MVIERHASTRSGDDGALAPLVRLPVGGHIVRDVRRPREPLDGLDQDITLRVRPREEKLRTVSLDELRPVKGRRRKRRCCSKGQCQE